MCVFVRECVYVVLCFFCCVSLCVSVCVSACVLGCVRELVLAYLSECVCFLYVCACACARVFVCVSVIGLNPKVCIIGTIFFIKWEIH